MSERLVDPRANINDTVDFKGDPVELIVGDEEVSIFVHRPILIKSSKCFKAAVKKEWTEEGIIKLPNENVDTINTYIHWLYTDRICCRVDHQNGDSTWITLANLYALGEKIIDAKLQNAVIDGMIATSRAEDSGHSWFPCVEAVRTVYEGTPRCSPCRRLLVNLWHDTAQASWMPEISKCPQFKLPYHFLEDLIIALLERNAKPGSNEQGYKVGEHVLPQTYYNRCEDEGRVEGIETNQWPLSSP